MDDYISREAAKSKKVYSNERHEYVVPVADLDWLSTADVRPVVRGKWGDNGIPGSMLCGCSECGFTCGAHSFNFCPNCGADMREGSAVQEELNSEGTTRKEQEHNG